MARFVVQRAKKKRNPRGLLNFFAGPEVYSRLQNVADQAGISVVDLVRQMIAHCLKHTPTSN